MFLLIDHMLTQHEIGFDPNHVDNTQKHRSKIVRYLARNEALNLEKN